MRARAARATVSAELSSHIPVVERAPLELVEADATSDQSSLEPGALAPGPIESEDIDGNAQAL